MLRVTEIKPLNIVIIKEYCLSSRKEKKKNQSIDEFPQMWIYIKRYISISWQWLVVLSFRAASHCSVFPTGIWFS